MLKLETTNNAARISRSYQVDIAFAESPFAMDSSPLHVEFLCAENLITDIILDAEPVAMDELSEKQLAIAATMPSFDEVEVLAEIIDTSLSADAKFVEEDDKLRIPAGYYQYDFDNGVSFSIRLSADVFIDEQEHLVGDYIANHMRADVNAICERHESAA